MVNQTTNPHDKFYRNIFGKEENVHDFLQNFLPREILEQIDLDKLYFDPSSYVDQRLQDSYSDILVKSALKSGYDTYIYFLFEHKRNKSPYIELQLLRYMVNIWEDFLNNRESWQNKLPIIIPIVIYNGQIPYNEHPNFLRHFDLPSEEFRAYIPVFQAMLCDGPRVNLEELQFSIILRSVFLLARYLDDPSLGEHLSEILSFVRELLDQDKAEDYLRLFLSYISQSTDQLGQEDINHAKKEIPQLEEIMPTLAEQWIKEGEQRGEKRGEERGEQRGEQNMLIEALQEKFGTIQPELMDKIRSIQSTESLRGLFRQVFKMENIHEFTQEIDKLF